MVREIAEEVGWAVSVGAILDSWQYHIDDGTDVLIVTYGCHSTTNADPVVSAEHTEVGLFTKSELMGLRMPDGYRKSIERWCARGHG